MANLILENIRELLTKYTFEIEGDNYDEKLICKICKKLMLDVYQSHCGCNFCHKCISDYLNEEAKYCPGEKEECKEEHLTLDRNVASNPRLNKKILKTKVRCPYESCLCFFALAQIEEHMRLCDKQGRECPYANIGCEDRGGLCGDKIMDHLHNEVFTHSKLLIELVENLRNDVNGLKLEIVSLKEESQRKELEMERQSREIEGLKEEMEIKELKMREMEDNILNVEKENINLKEEVKNIKIKSAEMEENIKNMNVESTKFRRETEEKLTLIKEENGKRENKAAKMEKDINNIKKDSMNLKDIVDTLKKEFGEYRNKTEEKFTSMKKETEKRVDIVDTLKKESGEYRNKTEEKFSSMKEETEKRVETIKQLKTKIEILNIKTDTAVCVGEIYFIVDKISERMKKSEVLYSRYFYSHSNGYKLRLAVYPGGYGEGKGSHISLYVFICEGEYGENLDWPCKYTFSISIINQRTKKDVKSETFNYLTVSPNVDKDEFNKPINIYNNIVYRNYTFMSHRDIEEDLTGGVKVDDCIIIKCFVSAPT